MFPTGFILVWFLQSFYAIHHLSFWFHLLFFEADNSINYAMNKLMVYFKVTISKAVRFIELVIDTDSNIMVLIIEGHFIKV